MLKQIYYSGTVKQSSYTEKVAFYAQDFKIRLRGVVASFWMLQVYRGPSCSAVLRNEEDREDNMQESFLSSQTHIPTKFPNGIKVIQQTWSFFSSKNCHQKKCLSSYILWEGKQDDVTTKFSFSHLFVCFWFCLCSNRPTRQFHKETKPKNLLPSKYSLF